jgi:hypothetical protein
MNTDYSMAVVGNSSAMAYRFSIIGYLFGRELWRKTFFCEDKKRGTIYAEWYLQNKVSNIACDRYRVEVFNSESEKTQTVLGGRAPNKQDPWRSDCADIVRGYSPLDTTFKAAVNQAGWKEYHGKSRVRSAAMRVGVGAGRH